MRRQDDVIGRSWNLIRNNTAVPLLLYLLVVCLPGCGGCRSDLDAEQRAEALRKKKLEQEKPDFEPVRVCILPASLPAVGAADDEEPGGTDSGDAMAQSIVRRLAVKPGHWTECWHQLKANKDDFSGRLSLYWSDRNRQPWLLERSKFQLVSSRPLALPKGQAKVIDAPTYVAVPNWRSESRSLQIEARLESRSGALAMSAAVPTIRLRPHQYFISVLAATPERYGFLKVLPTVQPPGENWSLSGISEDYFVVLPNVSRKVPVPQHGLAWTSIAYVIIDDFDPETMTATQQTAMTDWLHWGGQIIVNGPRSLERLQNTSLEKFLPSPPVPSVPITESQVAELNGMWSRVPRATRAAHESYFLQFNQRQPMQILQLEPSEGASFVPESSNLLAIKRVGRGSVIVTAFSLTDSRIINWRCFDNFFNACILQRSGRQFSDPGSSHPVQFTSYPAFGDARSRCGLRFFSRDARFPGDPDVGRRRALDADGPPQPAYDSSLPVAEQGPRAIAEAPDANVPQNSAATSEVESNQLATWQISPIAPGRGFGHDQVSGVAGWNDFSSAANAARSSVVSAAGIAVPHKSFVSRMLLAYLVCLVPLNWLVFRLLGRVEWAWFAAPAIAVIAAAAVIQLAQLDIGFARSRTDISIVELQGDYNRAHVTTYSGLYTSLTTRYRATFDDQGAQALPFSTNPTDQQLTLRNIQEVSLANDRKTALTGYPVFSNSTGMLHTEQMLALPGAITATRDQDGVVISNATGLSLRGVALLTRKGKSCQVATVSELADGMSVRVALAPGGSNQRAANQFFEMLEEHPVTAAETPAGEVSLRKLFQLAIDGRQLEEDQLRLVGWTDEIVSPVEVAPMANQRAARTFVVANLRYDHVRVPKPDKNSPEDYDAGAFWEVP